MYTVNDFSFDGLKAMVRVDFNVPLNDAFEITDDSRMTAAVPTLLKILNDGGSVILMSHLGRPKNGSEDKFSLKHIVKHLSVLLNKPVKFASDCIGEEATKIASTLRAGEVLLLENLRFYKEEEKGDEAFAQKLSTLGDFYVNDAFGTAHRAHASTAIIAKFFPGKKCLGLVMAAEIENAQRVMKHTERPFTAIIGGAKVSDKILIVENLMNFADNIIIGGGMAYTFFKAMGGEVGNSLLEMERIETCKQIIDRASSKGVNLLLPIDSVCADRFANDAKIEVCESYKIPEGMMGLDIGPEACQLFADTIVNSKTVLWNGPMGVFEMSSFANGTIKIATAVAEATNRGGFSLVGGGDSVAAIHQLGFEKQVSYISTGGGALLEYFEGKILPGISAVVGEHVGG